MKRILLFFTTFLLLVGTLGFTRRSNAAPSAWLSKVDPWVLETASGGEVEFLVVLAEQADLGGASRLPSKQAKGAFVYQQLVKTADRTQKPLLAYLKSIGVAYQPFWIANMVWVRGDMQLVKQLARRPEIARLSANPVVHLDLPSINPIPDALSQQTVAIEWNLTKVRAPEVWNAGFTGQGAVIAGQDTGYQWDHPALKASYRGWNGSSADHNYSWHDAIHPPAGGGICGTDSAQPCDDHGHGTHTMGIMVGDDGGDNQIGMAPGARWIGCRNMDQGAGTPATYTECFQWFLAPTDLNGNNPRPDLAPDVINNSWSCPPSEGCTDPNVLLAVVENVRAAGILTVQSAGNSGASCSTVNTPAAIYDASFSVGATDSADNIAGFSSRGPVTVDGSYRLKPDVSAPGVAIRSSVPTYSGSYGVMSGTSMAGPHVAGLAALMISADAGLSGQVDQLERLIAHSSLPRTTSQNCGSIPGSQVPNNTFGWGRIDSWKAVTDPDLQKSADSMQVSPGNLITYTLMIEQRYPANITNVVISDHVPENTSFITATAPYLINGNAVEWHFPSLAQGSTQILQLTVQAPPSGLWQIVNDNYSLTSDQTGTLAARDAVKVFVAEYFYFFPFVPRY